MKSSPHNTVSGANVLVSVGSCTCAIPLQHVVETMRPLHVSRIRGSPPFLLGLSVIRGAPVPVVELASLLGVAPAGASERLLVVASGSRRVALAVDRVVGVRDVRPEQIGLLPPLLSGAHADAIAAVGALDAELLLVLSASRIISDEVLTLLARADGAA